MPSVLFVCTGNICRSPMAEAIGRKMAADRGLDIAFDSAGVSAEERGNPPDEMAAETLKAHGYPVPKRSARPVRDRDFKAFDLIIAMTRRHEMLLSRAAPASAKSRIKLFSGFLENADQADIADPYLGSSAEFERVLRQLEAGMPRLIAEIAGST